MQREVQWGGAQRGYKGGVKAVEKEQGGCEERRRKRDCVCGGRILYYVHKVIELFCLS